MGQIQRSSKSIRVKEMTTYGLAAVVVLDKHILFPLVSRTGPREY